MRWWKIISILCMMNHNRIIFPIFPITSHEKTFPYSSFHRRSCAWPPCAMLSNAYRKLKRRRPCRLHSWVCDCMSFDSARSSWDELGQTNIYIYIKVHVIQQNYCNYMIIDLYWLMLVLNTYTSTSTDTSVRRLLMGWNSMADRMQGYWKRVEWYEVRSAQSLNVSPLHVHVMTWSLKWVVPMSPKLVSW